MNSQKQKDVPEKLVEDLENSRLRLRQLKPNVYRKLINYLEAEKNGNSSTLCLLDFTYGFECNFRCPPLLLADNGKDGLKVRLGIVRLNHNSMES